MEEYDLDYLEDIGEYQLDQEDEGEEEQEIVYHYIDMLDAPRDLPEPIQLTADQIKDITIELGLIKLCWPEIKNPQFEERVHFPESYLKNTNKEKLLLLYAENFRKQFTYKYPHRKQLFLATENECGMQKMVCTTIRPSTLPYPEIETWEKCSEFVGNHCYFEPFDYPTLIPDRLYSPHTTFMRRSGQSQELATALCSLLIGLGYDAYVVYGYATRDTTLKIMIRTESPYPLEENDEEDHGEDVEPRKYTVKPMRDLRSKFLLMMEQREIDKVKADKAAQKELERKRREKEELPPFDELEGQRYHFWVLIRNEGRAIDSPIFIEPTTGVAHPLTSPNYLGIESVWNHTNYWVNVQSAEIPLPDLDYDLHNVEKWEHLLVGEPHSWREAKIDINMEEEEVALAKIMDEKHLDMPVSWSMKISIPNHILKQKYPNGSMKTWYKRTLVEEYAPYVQQDGLIRKITRFSDFDCTRTIRIENIYEHRQDRLIKSVYDIQTDLITEYFASGREDAVLEHSYGGPESAKVTKRLIIFNHKARYDGLHKIELDAENMEEHYIDRDDLFYFRYVKYAKKGNPPPGMTEGHRKIILNICEKFLRNKKKLSSEDIAIREFALIAREIHLKYHFGEGKVTATTRSFTKPAVADVNEEILFQPELTSGYQAEIGAEPPRDLELFLLLITMIKEENNSVIRIREIENQISDFLSLRDQEQSFPTLTVSLFNQEQNEEYKQGMLEKEKQEQEYREKEIEDVEIDYLSPYLTKIKKTLKNLSRKDALKIKAQCLNDFKQLLLSRAFDIQKQFENWGEFLKSRQAWFNINQDTISEEDEIKYFQEVSDLTFLLQAYEIRLARHRDLSIPRYEALESYLNRQLKL